MPSLVLVFDCWVPPPLKRLYSMLEASVPPPPPSSSLPLSGCDRGVIVPVMERVLGPYLRGGGAKAFNFSALSQVSAQAGRPLTGGWVSAQILAFRAFPNSQAPTRWIPGSSKTSHPAFAPSRSVVCHT